MGRKFTYYWAKRLGGWEAGRRKEQRSEDRAAEPRNLRAAAAFALPSYGALG